MYITLENDKCFEKTGGKDSEWEELVGVEWSFPVSQVIKVTFQSGNKAAKGHWRHLGESPESPEN